MRNCPHIKTKREFIRERRRALKPAKKAIQHLRMGCAIGAVYGEDTLKMMKAVTSMNDSLRIIDEITKKLAQ